MSLPVLILLMHLFVKRRTGLAEAEYFYNKAIQFRKQSDELNIVEAIAGVYNDAGNFYLNICTTIQKHFIL